MNRDEILAANPLDQFVMARGKDIKRQGKEVLCRCFFHEDKHPSFRMDLAKKVWRCDPCDIGGSVIDLYAKLRGCDVGTAMREMSGEDEQPKKDEPAAKYEKTATYIYKTAKGAEVFRVDRMETAVGSKKFRQYRMVQGREINGLDGVERVLWRLPEVAQAAEVCIVEGEKCVQAVEAIDYVATTNPGGSSGWMDAYALDLAGKSVTVIPDNDKPGLKWLTAVTKSLEGRVKEMRIVRVPPEHNDIADLLATDGGASKYLDLIMHSTWVPRGVSMPLYSADEIMGQYKTQIANAKTASVDLGKWLPSMRKYVRRLVPGELVTVLADTGVGKSAILQNVAMSQRPIPVILFELELPGAQMGERFTALSHKIDAGRVESAIEGGAEFSTDAWNHVWTCTDSKMTIDDMEDMINRAELKIGKRPGIVMIDYIGLMKGGAGKRYERLSTIAEEVKVLAKSTNTVVFVASQVRRKEEGSDLEVNLHDAKDTGSIENSSGLVLSAWRPQADAMTIKICKDTKGQSGRLIECNYNGAQMLITERATNYAWEPAARKSRLIA